MVWSIYSSFLRTPRSAVDSSQRHQDLLWKILENAENRTQGFWVRSANAPSVLCPPDPPPPLAANSLIFNSDQFDVQIFFLAGKKFSKQQKKFVSIFCSNFFSATYFFSRCKKKDPEKIGFVWKDSLVRKSCKQKYFDELFPTGSVGLLGPRASLD